jgi:hypothetical protein
MPASWSGQARPQGLGRSAEERRLTYSELNMIFLHACRSPADDVAKKPEVFKVCHAAVVADQKARSSKRGAQHGNGTSTSISTSGSISSGGSYLSYKQFVGVLEAIAERLYHRLVLQVTGTLPECLSSAEQRKIKRMTFELLVVKLILPASLALEILPWELVYLQEFLTALPQQPILASYLQAQMALAIQLFRRYCVQSSSSLHALQPAPTAGGLDMQGCRDAVLGYSELSKLCREGGIVPYIINEQQLFSLHRELCSFTVRERGGFPVFSLPPMLIDSLQSHYAAVSQESRILGWVQARGYLLPPGNKKPSKRGDEAREEISLQMFVIFLGVVAVQVSIAT